MGKTKLENYKRTKILATLGPSTNTPDAISDMIDAGVNGFRLNFSHGDYDERVKQIMWVRSASRSAKKPVAILQDLQGPKIRCGEIEPVEVKTGDVIKLSYIGDQSEGVIPVQYDLSKKVKKGEHIYIFDGKIKTVVKAVQKGIVSVKILNSGWISSKKGINLPETDLRGDILTDKDKADIRWGAEHDIDYVALSFVQTAQDVKNLRSYLNRYKSNAKVIAKVETVAAVENIEEIVEAADGIMIARGDLAIETKAESVPIIQRKIIGLCQAQAKLCIVATQMLASMTEHPEPTRAEVNDVATATILGTDCVMLSDETASGDYPLEAIRYMKKIILYTEDNAPLKPLFYHPDNSSIASSISSAVMTLAHQVKAIAIVAETASGRTAINIAAHRPTMPVVMVTDSQRTAQQLALVYGGKSYVRKGEDAGDKMTNWLHKNKLVKVDDVVIITSGRYPGMIGGTDTIKVRRIK